jgi:Tfp pilus assembly protein PilO
MEEKKDEEKQKTEESSEQAISAETGSLSNEETSEPVVKENAFGEMMKNLSKRERIFAYAAIFFVLVLVLDKIVLSPILNKIDILENDINQEISIVRDGLLIIGYKDAIKNEYEQLKKFFYSERKTQEEELAGFLKDMETLAMDSGIHLITLNPSGNIEDTKQYTIYEVNLNCTGSMETIVTFLYKLSTNERPTKVENIEIIPPSKAEGDMQCNMLISRMFITA